MNYTFINNKIDEKILKALPNVMKKILAEQVRADSDKFVPRLTGDLRTFVDIKQTGQNKVELVYTMDYAIYQWYGVGMKNYTTPGTGAEWCEKARNVYGKDWERMLNDAIKREAGL